MIRTNSVQDLRHILKDKKVFVMDFDGTIADTESLHWITYNPLLKKYGVEFTEADVHKYSSIGCTEVQIYAEIKKDFNIDFDNNDFWHEICMYNTQRIKYKEVYCGTKSSVYFYCT